MASIKKSLGGPSETTILLLPVLRNWRDPKSAGTEPEPRKSRAERLRVRELEMYSGFPMSAKPVKDARPMWESIGTAGVDMSQKLRTEKESSKRI